MPKPAKRTAFPTTEKPQAFRFHVQLLSGPVTDAFMRANPEPPARIIDASGQNTLDELHEAIFDAFDRDDEHCYEFQLGGKKPLDRKAVSYGPPECCDDSRAKDATRTRIDSLGLKEQQTMFYWFDFGDDWWHAVTLLSISPIERKLKEYPYIVEKTGESPPQYIDWEEDDEAAEEQMEISPELQKRMDEIKQQAVDFCGTTLNEEYAEICVALLEEAVRARFDISRGKAQSWAAGLVYAAGAVNFLYDRASAPHIRSAAIAEHFGISQSTMTTKGRNIMDAVDAFPFDPRFCLKSMADDNPIRALAAIGLLGRNPNKKLF